MPAPRWPIRSRSLSTCISVSAGHPPLGQSDCTWACLAQLGLLHAEAKKTGDLSEQLTETEVIETLDEKICKTASFLGYGTLGVATAAKDGAEAGVENILNGDGIPHGKEGLVQKNAQWPDRLSRLCEQRVGEVGEEELYRLYGALTRGPLLQGDTNSIVPLRGVTWVIYRTLRTGHPRIHPG